MKKLGLIYFLFLTIFALHHVSYSDENNPIKAYDTYLHAVKSSNSLNEIKPYVSKNKISIYDSLSEEQKQSSLKFKKEIAENTVRTNIKSDTVDNKCTLTIQISDKATGKKGNVVVSLVLEDEKWKVDKETFDFRNIE